MVSDEDHEVDAPVVTLDVMMTGADVPDGAVVVDGAVGAAVLFTVPTGAPTYGTVEKTAEVFHL
jgi:hypothetical protein